jgi:cytochrome c-type biogenesis protein CcmH/NrfG
VGRAKTLLQTPNGDRLAEAELREATAEDPGNAEAWALLGSVFEARGVAPLAISAYKRALILESRNAQAREGIQRLSSKSAPPASASPLRRLFGRG